MLNALRQFYWSFFHQRCFRHGTRKTIDYGGTWYCELCDKESDSRYTDKQLALDQKLEQSRKSLEVQP